MTVVTELELPEIDYNQPGFGPDTYHQLLAAAREQSWLAHSPLAYIVLDGASGAHFRLGVNLARAELELAGTPVLGGIEGIYNVESLPLRWS